MQLRWLSEGHCSHTKNSKNILAAELQDILAAKAETVARLGDLITLQSISLLKKDDLSLWNNWRGRHNADQYGRQDPKLSDFKQAERCFGFNAWEEEAGFLTGRSCTDQTVTCTHHCGTVVGTCLFCTPRKTLGQCQQRCFSEVTLLPWSTREDNKAHQ